MFNVPVALGVCVLLTAGCAPDAPEPASPLNVTDDADNAADAAWDSAQDATDTTPTLDGDTPDASTEAPTTFRVMTFNTGSGASAPADGNAGFNRAQGEISDTWYGNGLAWLAVIADTQASIAALDPDVVVFQEIFHPADCPGIPAEHHAGFVCETDPEGTGATVVQQLLGPDWQVVCHPQKPDKCAAVHRRFGRFRGCEDDLCLDHMRGETVPDCGRGARVAAAIIDRTDGGVLNVINVHGTSGFSADEQRCRTLQVEQVFVTDGDRESLVDAEHPNVILGDFNTDPGRMTADASADAWNAFVGPDTPFHFLTDATADGPATYAVVSIDHVVSDQLTGVCWHPGVSPDTAPVTSIRHFDHVPAVCDLRAATETPTP